MKIKKNIVIILVLMLCLNGYFWKKKPNNNNNSADNQNVEKQNDTVEISDEIIIPVEEGEESFGE